MFLRASCSVRRRRTTSLFETDGPGQLDRAMKAQVAKIRRERCAGFNLVEIAMALAIISFSCTCLLGLLPASLTAFHQAMGNTIESQIVQSISNDVALNNFSALSSSNFPVYYYYDHEGQLLSSSATSSPPAGYFYTAQVAFTTVTSSNSPADLSASPTPAYKVNVTITNVAQSASLSAAKAHVYSFIVANNGL